MHSLPVHQIEARPNEEESKLTAQVIELADFSAASIKNLMRLKPKIKFEGTPEFQKLLEMYGRVSEREFAPMFYHGSDNEFAEVLYWQGLNDFKCRIIAMAMDYAAQDQKLAFLYTVTNVFHNGFLRPLDDHQFQELKREIGARIEDANRGDAFHFSLIGARKIFSDPIQQLAVKEENRPQIKRLLISPNVENTVDNIFYGFNK